MTALACVSVPAGCGGGSSTPDGAGQGSDESSESSSSAPPTTARGPLGSGEPVTIAFAGDASFEGLADQLATNPEGLLADIGPVLGAADLTVVNLEAALTDGPGTPEPKSFAFAVTSDAIVALQAAGVDAVTMANNHGMDFGADGLADSLRIERERMFPVLGIGADAEEAYEPWIVEVRGQRIGVIAANDVFDSSLVADWTAGDAQPGIASAEEASQDRLAQVVRSTRDDVDTLAVFLHYGTERETCPNGRQQELATLLTEAGADIVVGTHAHRLQGMGYLGDQFVAYGLSNFVFKASSAEARRSGVLTVTATGRRIDDHRWDPAVLEGNVPRPLTGAAADAERAAMDALRDCTGLTGSPTGPGIGA